MSATEVVDEFPPPPGPSLRDRITELRAQVTQRMVLAACVVVLLVAGLIGTAVTLIAGAPQYRYTAQFVATPGLYSQNAVAILGVPTGHVVSVTPRADHVDVVISLPRSVRVPASAQAVLMAPNPVSDRFVELTPPYTGGPTLAPGAVIPLSRTVVPLELDDIYGSVDQLSKDLGPSGANQNGELSAVLHSFAQLASGNGTDVHAAITSIAAALPALTAHPDELAKLVTGLDTLTKSLAAHNASIDSLYSDLATATSQLAGERQTIAAAAANLQQGLAQVAAFLKTNQSAITGSVQNLNTTLSAVLSEQQSLIKTFDLAPLGFQNFNRATSQTSDCISGNGTPHDCAAIWGRVTFPKDIASFVKTYCGTLNGSFVPILEANAGLADAHARETACGALLGLLQDRTGPPGSPAHIDLDLTHYLGSN
jgi:phospholipid/cholesterol/gamma-HCH transport system substrate-binding protein